MQILVYILSAFSIITILIDVSLVNLFFKELMFKIL